jgi:hypothetical protein
MTSQSIDTELVQRAATFAGLAVPDGDLALLLAAAQNQLASAEHLRTLELDDVEPIVTFDPRWP